MDSDRYGDDLDAARWLQTILRESLRRGYQYDDGFEAAGGQGIPRARVPPERIEYVRKLIRALLDGRVIVATYNLVLLVVLGIFVVVHMLDKRRCRRRWNARKTETAGQAEVADGSDGREVAEDASSSSSSMQGIITPSGAAKDADVDIERLPLLRARQQRPNNPNILTRTSRRLTDWLEYQPRPLPVINRTLPSNGISLFVTAWLGLNIFFHIYRLPLHLNYFFCFADRAGLVFTVNLPLLYLLAAKNQPLKLLTGRSYEALNIFHRRVGELLCLDAVVHFGGMLLWRLCLQYKWMRNEDKLWDYFTHPIIALGIGAFVAYEVLFFTSLGSFRRRWYELFLASHVVLQVLALWFLYLHFHTAKPYVKAALVIFLVDRVVWRMGFKSATVSADLVVLPDGDTILLSADWDKPTSSGFLRWSPWPKQSIKHGWKPTDHVFLTIPVLGWKHALQAHPFTIASAAPDLRPELSSRDARRAGPPHMWLSLLIRAHEGFTANLLSYAHRHRSVSVRLDGPYGSSHALEMLRAADNAVLVAGGSGIAVTFPLVWALLMDDRDKSIEGGDVTVVKRDKDIQGDRRVTRPKRQKVHMMWIIHSDEHHLWMPKERLDELVVAGLDLVIPPPTALAGRPDVVGIVDSWIKEAADAQTAVVVSGPDGLNRMVRNTCAGAVGRGIDVRTAVEKFGW